MKTLYWIDLPRDTPIFERLQLEEALLRSETASFCIAGIGSPRAIVMGCSSDPKTLLNLPQIQEHNVPVIRRFSGGGTVIVDGNTLFFSLILQKSDLDIPPFPESILRWTASLYERAWNIPDFALKENDYCILDKKCGGNAQYIRKERWIHHTSFLWDYCENNMQMLSLPPKRPAYRQDREHTDFLCRLKAWDLKPEALIEAVRTTVATQFTIKQFDLASWQTKPHRQSTHYLRDC